MREATYIGAICGREGSYGIVFPDFLGCISAGDTIEDVVRSGHEALQFHIDGMDEDGDPIPEPREWTLKQIDELLGHGDADEEPWVELVSIKAKLPEPSDRVSIDIPPLLARDVDAVAPDRKRFIIDAARRELLRLKASA